MSDKELVKISNADVLKNNSFGILESEGTVEEKMMRLVGLVPMALEVVDEARETIRRLREENDRYRELYGPLDPV